jgi:hypothetical protein
VGEFDAVAGTGNLAPQSPGATLLSPLPPCPAFSVRPFHPDCRSCFSPGPLVGPSLGSNHVQQLHTRSHGSRPGLPPWLPSPSSISCPGGSDSVLWKSRPAARRCRVGVIRWTLGIDGAAGRIITPEGSSCQQVFVIRQPPLAPEEGRQSAPSGRGSGGLPCAVRVSLFHLQTKGSRGNEFPHWIQSFRGTNIGREHIVLLAEILSSLGRSTTG